MDALQLLKADHEKVTKLLEKLEKVTESDIKLRERMFTQIREELILHEKLEEELLYPLLKTQDATRSITLESYQEHHLLDVLLEEMTQLNCTDEAWTAKLKVLKENLEHHIEEEEEKMFPKAKKILTSTTLKELGEKMENLKESEMA